MFYKFRFLIGGLLILILASLFGILYVSLAGKGDPIDYNTPTKKLNGIFEVYDGIVYAIVPSNGYYEVIGADGHSFKTYTDSFQDAHIGFDDRYVYAGNMILKGLNPKNLKVLANNYYTDGETSYYCARNSEKNENLSDLGFVVQLLGQSMGLADKPQNYWYPFLELPKNQVYTSKAGFAIGGNAHQAFFKGLEMPKADPKSIRPLPIKYLDGDVRESDSYFTDGKNVYYENQLLPVAYNDRLFEIGIEGDVPSRSAYLINDQHGMVYANGHPFDESKAPYKMLSADLKHANQALFGSREGIYFYDPEADKIKRAGDNPFKNNNFKQLAPDVFSSGKKVYYLLASEHRGRKTGLSSRSTYLMELENVLASDFKKLDDGQSRYNNIWQTGNRYFYFDNFGSSNFMSAAVYEIKDAITAQEMLTKSDLRHDDIQRLRSSDALSLPASEKVLSSSISYNGDWFSPYLIIFGGVVIAFFVGWLLRNKKIAPFILENGYLIFNNLNFRRYRITEIEKVVFSVVKSNYRTNSGYSGSMQVIMKNGHKSFNTRFSTKVTLLSESEETIWAYIEELKKVLEKEGIRSKLVV